MRHRPWTVAAITSLILLATPLLGDTTREDEKKADRKALEETLYKTLRDVINRGADLYNSGDMAGCYRLYEGSLRSITPLLDHKPDLQKAISKSISGAEGDPVVWRRAFTLRASLDKVREELNPKKGEKLPEPKKEDKKDNGKKDEKKEEKKDKDRKDDDTTGG